MTAIARQDVEQQPTLKDWELVHCLNPDCNHSHVRERAGRRVLPCVDCGGEMAITPLITRPPGFDLGDMRLALRQLVDDAREQSGNADEQRARWIHAGRCAAYAECLDMLEHAIDTTASSAARRPELSRALEREIDNLTAEMIS
jgi:hypothetical protein